MSIEEPEPGQLFLRFDYETLQGGATAPLDEFYSSFAKQAYIEADIDTVGTIRRLAAEAGALGLKRAACGAGRRSGREFHHSIAALFLGEIHGAIGARLDGVDAAAVIGVARESDADAGVDALALELQRGRGHRLE